MYVRNQLPGSFLLSVLFAGCKIRAITKTNGTIKRIMPYFCAVAVKNIIAKAYQEAPIERVLGQQARVLQRLPLSVHSHIHAEYIQVSFDEQAWPEEHARLNLFPVADGQFCVQLMYLQYTAQPGMADICWIEFKPAFFEQFPLSMISKEQPFRFDQVTEQQFTICSQSQALLQQLKNATALTSFTTSLLQVEHITHLLRRSLECIALPFTVCPVPACRFLANDSERDKVMEAQRVITANLDNPLTIKELSRKVAMNECYLKKGFKALTGKTIHEYTQELRISRAKEMLSKEGLSVSDVANTLGFSSISHFSTSFKKATGMKPCELLH